MPSSENQTPEAATDGTAAPASKSRRTLKWLFRLSLLVLFLIILLGLALSQVPRMVSSEWFRQRLEREALSALQRPLRVDTLNWTWSDGILLEGLEVADDPAFSSRPLISIDRILLALDLEELLRRRLVLDLKLEGMDTRLIRNPEGHTNLELLLSPMKRPQKPEPKTRPEKDWRLFSLAVPLDIQARIHVSKVSLLVEDRAQDRTIKIHDASFLVKAPSLVAEPITLVVSAKEEMDGRALPPIHLSAQIENLFDSKASLNISEAAVKIEGHLPGARIAVKGTLGDMGLNGNMELDLAPLANMARPFLGPSMPDISGRIELDVDLSGNPARPITFVTNLIGTDLSVSGGPLKGNHLGPIWVRAFHKGILDLHRGTLEMKKGEIRFQDKSRLSWHGTLKNLTTPEPKADLTLGPISLDLAELGSLAKAFVPADVSGRIELNMKASGNIKGPLDFDITVNGTDLVLSSDALLKGEQVGPVSLRASHKGVVDIPKGLLDMKKGEIRVQEKSHVSWHGTLKNLTTPNPDADLTLGPLSLDLKELYALAEPLVPHAIPIQFGEGAGGEASPSLRVKDLRLMGPIPAGPQRVILEGLFLALPSLRMVFPKGSLRAEDLNLRVPRGDVDLESFFPSRAGVSAALRVHHIHFKGVEEILVKGLEVPSCRVIAKAIALSPKALFGVKGSISLDESARIKRVTLPSRARIDGLRQSLKAEFLLGPGPYVEVQVKRVAISSPSLRIYGLGQSPIETGMELEAGVAGLHLQALNPLRADIKKAKVRMNVGKLFHAKMEAFAQELGSKRLDTHGQISINLRNLIPLLPPSLLPRADLAGRLDVGWNFLGRLPAPEEIERLTGTDMPLVDRLRQIEFLNELQVLVGLKDLSLYMGLSEDTSLRVSGIDSITPLNLTLKKGLKKGKIEGKVVFGRIEELPALGKIDQPMKVTLSFSGDQDDLKTVRFSETIQLEPLNVVQSAQLTLHKIDRLLTLRPKSHLPVLLRGLEGEARGTIRADLDADLGQYSKGLSLKGRLEAGAEIDLAGGKELRTRGWLESPGLDLRSGNLLRITNLKSHLNLEKRYLMVSETERAMAGGHESTPLSVEVLNPRAETPARTGESVVRRLMDDLRGRLSSQRSLSFDSAGIKAGPLHVEISNHELEFRLFRGLPLIDFFQLDLLGGTLIGSLSVSEQEGAFELKANFSFSGLNAKKLLPGVVQEVSDEEAELTGQVSLRLPLSTDPRRVLDDIRASVDLTHIGSRTLERLLYAMDPSESNETIVRQRNLLRMGTPRWMKLKIQYGNLAMSGQVEVKGIQIDLPRIERFNVADLPVRRQLEDSLSSLGPVLNILKVMSADGIHIDPEGALSFVSSGN